MNPPQVIEQLPTESGSRLGSRVKSTALKRGACPTSIRFGKHQTANGARGRDPLPDFFGRHQSVYVILGCT